MTLEILFQDAYLVAINKPHGLLVHRSKYADEAKVFAVQELRNQIGQHVYPIHRLDRKTGGVLLFALSPEINALMNHQFSENKVDKKYYAVVRGYTPDSGTIDYPLENEVGTIKEAVTHYATLERTEIPIPLGKFQSSRYSLIEAKPDTGRMHQIRKHFAHIFHPIIGDRPHGCNKQNRMFKERWNMDTMLLHAHELSFVHPITQQQITIKASLQAEFLRSLEILEMSLDHRPPGR